MKSSCTKVVLGLLAATLMVGIGWSQTLEPAHMPGHGDMFSEHMLGFFTDMLNLTDAQQAQIKDILAKEKTATEPYHQQMAQSHQAMMQLVQSGSFDEGKARTIATQQSQAMIELEVQRARSGAAMFQVLTPDQQTRMVQFMNKREQRWMKPPPDAGPDQKTENQ